MRVASLCSTRARRFSFRPHFRVRAQRSCTQRAGVSSQDSSRPQEMHTGAAAPDQAPGRGCTRSAGRRRARTACQSSHSSSVDSRHLAVAAASSGASAGSVRFTAAGCARHQTLESRTDGFPKPPKTPCVYRGARRRDTLPIGKGLSQPVLVELQKQTACDGKELLFALVPTPAEGCRAGCRSSSAHPACCVIATWGRACLGGNQGGTAWPR